MEIAVAGGTAAHGLGWHDGRMISHMGTRCAVAALLLVPCSIFVAACAAPVEPEADTLGELAERWPATSCALDTEPTDTGDTTGEAQQQITYVDFFPSDFQFVTTVGEGDPREPGGWQVARASLKFWDILVPTRFNEWYCTLAVEMPLRTQLAGRIWPQRAAELSVEIAEDAGRRMDYKLPPGVFCTKFIGEMRKTLKAPKYRKFGARITV